MNTKRGRPTSLLAQMKGETLEEIRNTIIYGTPAWRIIRLRQLLGDRRGLLPNGTGLRPNYLSFGLAAMEAHGVQARANAGPNLKALDRLYNESRAKNKGKPPARAKWLEERNKLLAQLPKPPPLPDKTWTEAACLWRELSMQIETALVIGDDEWLDELAKAIREGESLKQHADRARFTVKVLDLFPKMKTASDIYNALETREVWVRKGKLEVKRLKVEGHDFENKARVMDAIHDIEAKIGFALKRIAKPLHHE